ncbi:hypothetical protein HYC85_030017 [Camellia sinensis]|uniref:Uncharacterized protein n=1 Tax=Camellia sinensis TaxID=4442 RepID=A0A7J7G3H8_CAMSI|nr:hypothetical protein HYC85_030017 [Camellia sinensis]
MSLSQTERRKLCQIEIKKQLAEVKPGKRVVSSLRFQGASENLNSMHISPTLFQ